MGDNTLSTWGSFYGESFVNDVLENNPIAQKSSRDRTILNRLLNHKHMIETMERFKWKGLPDEITNDLIERIIFFRFKGAMFKSDLGRYIFLPFALKGKDTRTIDSMGRYETIIPVLFTGQWSASGDGEKGEDIQYMPDRYYDVVYDLPSDEETESASTFDKEGNEEVIELGMPKAENKAVILTDSSLEISQDYLPAAITGGPLNEQLTDILVLVNMDLISSAKMFYIVAKDEEQKSAIEHELQGLDQRILNGKRYVVIAGGALELKELTGSAVKDSSRYFQSYQSIDNIRKSIIGEANGGTFMKQEHTTQMESQVNGSDNESEEDDPVFANALRMRKEFCTKINKVFGLNVDVEPRVKQKEADTQVASEGSQTKDRKGEGDE